MTGSYSAIPVDQVSSFWQEVERSLRQGFDGPDDEPLRAIMRYRDAVERVGPLVYHREPDEVTDDIRSGGFIKTGKFQKR